MPETPQSATGPRRRRRAGRLAPTSRRRGTRPSPWRVGAVAGVALALAACGEAPQSVLDPAGPNAESPDNLFRIVLMIALAVFIVVQALIVWAVIRYRDRGEDSPMPVQVHGNTRMEIVWTVIPALILAVIAVPTISTVFDLAESPDDALVVEVIGHRWWWEYRYPGMGTDGGDIVTANEMVLPADTPVRLDMTAQEAGGPENAVIHSYWVPALAGKQDVVPGRITTLNLVTTDPGTFMGQCTEYCGLSHANMRNYATVLTQDEFDTWLEDQSRPAAAPPEGSEAARGAELFVSNREVEGLGQRNCASCHAIDGYEGPGGETAQGNVGPDLTHLMSREMFAGAIYDLYLREEGAAWDDWSDEPDVELLTQWLVNAPELKAMRPTGENAVGMPNMGLSEDEARAIAEYLITLK